jgi:hypothetical protein
MSTPEPRARAMTAWFCDAFASSGLHSVLHLLQNPGPGQSQYPQQGVALRGLPRRRSETAGRVLRMALYAQAIACARRRRASGLIQSD